MTGLEWAIMVFFMGRTLLEIQQLRAIYIDMKRYKQRRELKMNQRLKESFQVYTRYVISNGAGKERLLICTVLLHGRELSSSSH